MQLLGASFYSHVGEKTKRVPHTEDWDRLGVYKRSGELNKFLWGGGGVEAGLGCETIWSDS